MDNKEILDTLTAAKQYLSRLKLLDNEIESAVKQIINTYEETEKNIHETFSNLKDTLVNILNKRENCLLDQAKKTRKEGLTPLQECRIVLLEKIETTNKLINIGNSVINGGRDNLAKFTTDACLLGSLPEVPELKEVPFISFHCEPTSEIEVKDVLAQFGEVCRIAPIQITELIEKPGAILVEWQSVENEDRMTDIQEFRLQRAFGDVINEKHLLVNFNDCYKGLDTQFLVKDLQADQPYSFRVCCKFEGTLEWSPWSLPQVSRTTLKPFSWRVHEDYVMSNENKIAKPIKNNPRILFSDGPQFCVGHSVEFTVRENAFCGIYQDDLKTKLALMRQIFFVPKLKSNFLDVDSSDAIVGLVCEDPEQVPGNLNSAGENSFLINRHGKIFVDGAEKSTKLSDFTTGLKVCFTCDLVNDQKVRVNIDSNDKRVTYDWPVSPESKLFFVSQFFSSNWKVMVE